MNISYNWLKQYVDFDLAPAELSAKLTMAGLEVESVRTAGAVPDGVVTAKILSRRKHDNSDHLSICEVDRGGEVLQIVCGAPNCDAGKTVPLATIGTVFPDGDGSFTIKKGKIRGVESFGMMCSARELGLGSDHDGLMILPPDTPIGVPLSSLIKTDTVYDCSVTPNRPDWLSHLGVARDLAALLDLELKKPVSAAPAFRDSGEWNELVTVEAPDLCPRYSARVIRGVTIKDSPEWLKERLTAVGIRPINNVVDITNFVLMEYGQPLHTFDSRYLAGKRIVVRRAKNGEKITALDGKTYELRPENLVIADAEKPVAIAGVMGGEYSGIMPDTTEIVLESAYFEPASIRATSRALALSSDSSYRYERGADPETVVPGSLRAAALILELAGGEIVSPLIECFQEMPPLRKIDASFDRIRALLGMTVSDDEMAAILGRLGFASENRTDNSCIFTVPSWRMADVMGEADLAEEIARIHGLDRLPDVPIQATQDDFSLDDYRKFEELRTQLCGVGLDEILCGSMIDEKSALADGMFRANELVRMNNPISLELAVMRPSLLPGLLGTVRHNIARKNIDLALFEIGHVFCQNRQDFPEERDELAIAVTGRVHPERYSSERAALADFYDLKGILESLLDIRRVKSFSFRAAEDPRFVKGRTAEILIGGKNAGYFGEIVPELTRGMRLTTPLFAALLQLDSLFAAAARSPFYQALSPFPPTARDVAFLAPKELENQTVTDFILGAHLPHLESVELFDIFEDPALGDGKKSMAYSLVFRAPDRTLTDDEVNAAHEKLRARLVKGLGVELR